VPNRSWRKISNGPFSSWSKNKCSSPTQPRHSTQHTVPNWLEYLKCWTTQRGRLSRLEFRAGKINKLLGESTHLREEREVIVVTWSFYQRLLYNLWLLLYLSYMQLWRGGEDLGCRMHSISCIAYKVVYTFRGCGPRPRLQSNWVLSSTISASCSLYFFLSPFVTGSICRHCGCRSFFLDDVSLPSI
jgi:hypothetical protein